MIAGRRSKTVAFVAILALTTFGALATASAQPADIKAIDKAFQDHYARGNYAAAQIDAQELERLVKARFGADHAYYAVALNKLGIAFQAQASTPRRRGCTSARWRFAKKYSVRTTPTWGKHSTTWPSSMEPRPNTRRLRASSNAHWPSRASHTSASQGAGGRGRRAAD